ncbi:MAG: DUF285 domain-containing protein, partial [Allobaculum sp.]|nr:DUF285 domain-containing protein [Allobaculum sp.]
GLFRWCTHLERLDVSRWNVDLVQNMNRMFAYCISLSFLDLSKWNLDSVLNAHSIFKDCFDLEVILPFRLKSILQRELPISV